MKRNSNSLHVNVKLKKEDEEQTNHEQDIDHGSIEEQHEDLYAFLNFDGADNALSLVSPLQFDIKSLMLTPRSSSGKRSTSVKAALARTGRNPSTAAACSMPSPSHFFHSPEVDKQVMSMCIKEEEQVDKTLECDESMSTCLNSSTEEEEEEEEEDELEMDDTSIHENILLKTPPDSLVWPDRNQSSSHSGTTTTSGAVSTLEEDLRIAPSTGHAEHDSFFSFAHSLSPLAASEEFEHGLLPLRLSPLVSLGGSDLPRLIPPFPLPKFGDSPPPGTVMTLGPFTGNASGAGAFGADARDGLLTNDSKQTPVKLSQEPQHLQCTPEYMIDTSSFPKIQASTSATPGQEERSKIHRTMKLQFSCGSAERSNTKREMQFINNSLKRKSQVRKRKLETSSPSSASHTSSYPAGTERPSQKPATNVQRKLLQTPSKSTNSTMRSPLRPLFKSRAGSNVLFGTTSKNTNVTSGIKQEAFDMRSKENNSRPVTNTCNHHSHGTRLNTKSLVLQTGNHASSAEVVVPMVTTTPKNSTTSARKKKKTPKKNLQNLSQHHPKAININQQHAVQGSTSVPATSGGAEQSISTTMTLTTPIKTPPTRMSEFYSRNNVSSSKGKLSHLHTNAPSMISPMEESAAVTSSTSTSVTSDALQFLPNGRKKKAPCNCKKSKCLKLYCECFASGGYCDENCNCVGCANTPATEELRQQAMNLRLEKNPNAFKPKIESSSSSSSSVLIVGSESASSNGPNILNGKLVFGERTTGSTGNTGSSHHDPNVKSSVIVMDATTNPIGNGVGVGGADAGAGGSVIQKMHKNGCHCKKSACRKKYCECFQAGVPCGDNCRCIDCKNQPCTYHQKPQAQPIQTVASVMTSTTHYINSSSNSLLPFVSPRIAASTQANRRTRIDRETWTKNFSSPFEVSPRSERLRLHQMKKVTTSTTTSLKSNVAAAAVASHHISFRLRPPPTVTTTSTSSNSTGTVKPLPLRQLSPEATKKDLLTSCLPPRVVVSPLKSPSQEQVKQEEQEKKEEESKIYVYPLFGQAFPPLEKQVSGKIFQCLTNADLYNASLVNHLWNRVALGDTVWDHDTYIEVLDALDVDDDDDVYE